MLDEWRRRGLADEAAVERRGRKARCRFELGRQERCGAAPVRPARQQHGSKGAGSARGQPPGCGSCSRPAAHPAALGRGPGGPSLTAVHGDHKWRGPGEPQSLGRTALSMLCHATPALGFHRPPGALAQLPRHSTSREHSSRRPQAPPAAPSSDNPPGPASSTAPTPCPHLHQPPGWLQARSSRTAAAGEAPPMSQRCACPNRPAPTCCGTMNCVQGSWRRG